MKKGKEKAALPICPDETERRRKRREQHEKEIAALKKKVLERQVKIQKRLKSLLKESQENHKIIMELKEEVDLEQFLNYELRDSFRGKQCGCTTNPPDDLPPKPKRVKNKHKIGCTCMGSKVLKLPTMSQVACNKCDPFTVDPPCGQPYCHHRAQD